MVHFISTDTIRGLQSIITACEVALKLSEDVNHIMALNKLMIETNKKMEDMSISLKTIE